MSRPRVSGDRLLAHLRECVAGAERVATPEQRVAAEMHLASFAPSVQRALFSAPPPRESCPEDVRDSRTAGRLLPGVPERLCKTKS